MSRTNSEQRNPQIVALRTKIPDSRPFLCKEKVSRETNPKQNTDLPLRELTLAIVLEVRVIFEISFYVSSTKSSAAIFYTVVGNFSIIG